MPPAARAHQARELSRKACPLAEVAPGKCRWQYSTTLRGVSPWLEPGPKFGCQPWVITSSATALSSDGDGLVRNTCSGNRRSLTNFTISELAHSGAQSWSAVRTYRGSAASWPHGELIGPPGWSSGRRLFHLQPRE